MIPGESIPEGTLLLSPSAETLGGDLCAVRIIASPAIFRVERGLGLHPFFVLRSKDSDVPNNRFVFSSFGPADFLP